MPITIPSLDDRKYQDLLDESLARIPIHNPEWTNFNKSDPGVTLIEVFAFLTENLLYRSNQIPERNRRKFLSLLGVPLQAAASARGLVTFSNERGALRTVTLNTGLEVAGQVPFRTEAGLDVLPIEAQVFYKQPVAAPSQQTLDYYAQLYASYTGDALNQSQLRLYETRALDANAATGIDLGSDQVTIDGSLWIALLVRTADKPYAQNLSDARKAIEGKTISLGLVPYINPANRTLLPRPADQTGAHQLEFQIPKLPPQGLLPTNDPTKRVPQYQTLATAHVPIEPSLVQITLPAAADLALWSNFDPLEAGVGDFPPNLEDTTLNERVITWLRVYAPRGTQFSVLWTGLNAAFVSQRARVANELLPTGTGEPDQVVMLAKTPVIPDSVTLGVNFNGQDEDWHEIDDLLSAGPEVPTPDRRLPPGAPPIINTDVNVFTIDEEAGAIRFGDGTRGRRPPRGAILRATYDYGVGRDGNVGAGAIDNGPALPAGLKVTNPVRTWGGAEGETVSEGEKQIARYLQHRDRLVSAIDFETITLRTPGVDIGRVDVQPAYNPDLGQNEPGGAPGAVTLMIVPKYDPAQPDTPEPDQVFLNTICSFLDSRRLVTTEVFLRGPKYKSIWISIGLKVVSGANQISVAEVREAVKQAIQQFLSPLPPSDVTPLEAQTSALAMPQYAEMQRGWPLRRNVLDRELMAVASRVPGVQLVNAVLLAEEPATPTGTITTGDEIAMTGLQLPRIKGIAVTVGDPIDINQLRGQPSAAVADTGGSAQSTTSFRPVPVVPEECS